MGMDNIFVRVKKNNINNFKNHDSIDVYFFDSEELESLIDFRKAYDLDEIIQDIVKKSTWGDYIVLNKKDINKIIKSLENRFYKHDIYENEYSTWIKYYNIIQSLELINKLFDYDKYYLLYIVY